MGDQDVYSLGTLFVLWSLLPTILTIVMQSPASAIAR
jgi:hypothetical protein